MFVPKDTAKAHSKQDVQEIFASLKSIDTRIEQARVSIKQAEKERVELLHKLHRLLNSIDETTKPNQSVSGAASAAGSATKAQDQHALAPPNGDATVPKNVTLERTQTAIHKPVAKYDKLSRGVNKSYSQGNESTKANQNGTKPEPDAIVTEKPRDQEPLQEQQAKVAPKRVGAPEVKAGLGRLSAKRRASMARLTKTVEKADESISELDKDRLCEEVVQGMQLREIGIMMEEATATRDVLQRDFRQFLDQTKDNSVLDLKDTAMLCQDNEYQDILGKLAAKRDECENIRIVIEGLRAYWYSLSYELRPLMDKATNDVKLMRKIMVIKKAAKTVNLRAFRAKIRETVAKQDKTQSQSVQTVERTIRSLPRGQLPYVRDFNSLDDIRPGDKVSCISPCPPRDSKAFELSRGDMFKVVNLYIDRRAECVRINERAIDYNPECEERGDEEISKAPREGEPPEPSGELKAIPLNNVCLSKHWKLCLPSYTITLDDVHLDESQESGSTQPTGVDMMIPPCVRHKATQEEPRVALDVPASTNNLRNPTQGSLVNRKAVPFRAHIAINTTENLILSSFISTNVTGEDRFFGHQVYHPVALDRRWPEAQFQRVQFTSESGNAQGEDQEITPQFQVSGSMLVPIEFQLHLLTPEFFVCDHIFADTQYEQNIVAVVGRRFLSEQFIRTKFAQGSWLIQLPPPAPPRLSHLAIYTHGFYLQPTAPCTKECSAVDLKSGYSKSGYGIHFDDLPEGWNIHAAFSDNEYIFTSERAELFAIIRAIQLAFQRLIRPYGNYIPYIKQPKHRYESITIYTESNHAVEGFHERLPKWRDNQFQTTKKKTVANVDCWKYIGSCQDNLYGKGVTLGLVKVKSEDNQKSRELAHLGALHERFVPGKTSLAGRELFEAAEFSLQWTPGDRAWVLSSRLPNVDAEGSRQDPNMLTGTGTASAKLTDKKKKSRRKGGK